MYKIVAQQFPNNETRVTLSSIPGGRDPFKEPDPDEMSPCTVSGSGPVSEGDFLPVEDGFPLLSLVSNSKTPRGTTGYGTLPAKPTRFGLAARRALLRSGGALEKTAPTHEVLFLTGTLPGSTEDSFRSLAEYSAYIVNGLKAWIANYAPSKLDFYVWEYQKRGALHLHYAVHVPDERSRDYILKSFREWWIQILHRVGDKSGVDMFRKNASKTWLGDESKVRAVAEVCRKSVARYLAKYLSKSAAPKRGAARAFTPSRWWGVSRPLKALTDSLTSVSEIAVGGFHAIRRVWEDVKAMCDSSESVTHTYRHKVGEGLTLVAYTADTDERLLLWQNLESNIMTKLEHSQGISTTPSVALRALKNRQVKLLRESLTSLSPSFQGLSNTLENHLNWIYRITPSTSQDVLSLLLAWTANISDIRSMCQFTPVMNTVSRQEFANWLDVLENAIEDVAQNGWR